MDSGQWFYFRLRIPQERFAPPPSVEDGRLHLYNTFLSLFFSFFCFANINHFFFLFLCSHFNLLWLDLIQSNLLANLSSVLIYTLKTVVRLMLSSLVSFWSYFIHIIPLGRTSGVMQTALIGLFSFSFSFSCQVLIDFVGINRGTAVKCSSPISILFTIVNRQILLAIYVYLLLNK